MKKNWILYLFVTIVAFSLIIALIGCDGLPTETPSGQPSGSPSGNPEIIEPSGSPEPGTPSGTETPDDNKEPSGTETPDDKQDPSGSESQQPSGPIVHTVSINGETCLVLDGETVPLPSSIPVMEGKYFIGWYLGEEEYDFSSPVTTDLTIDAKWGDNKNLIVGTVVAYDGGDVEGAIVRLVDGSQETTVGADGSFSLGGAIPGEYELIIDKLGYIEAHLSIDASDYDSTALAVVEEIELIRQPISLGTIGGNKVSAVWEVFVTRSSTGIMYSIKTSIDNEAVLEDSNYHFETYFSIGETLSATRNNDVYYVKFYLNGNTAIYNFPSNVGTCLEALTAESSVVSCSWRRTDTEIIGEFFVDYDMFKLDSASSAISPYDVIGITMLAGTTSSAIDVWMRPDMPGYTSNEVVRGNRYDYLRIDSNNNLFENTDNKEVYIIKGSVESDVTVSCGGVSAVVDSDGGYKLIVPDNGEEEIQLVYSRLGYESQTKTICVDRSARYYNAEGVSLIAATGSISGRVTDGNNVLSGAIVLYGEQSVITDEEGCFVLNNVPMNAALSLGVSLSGYANRSVEYSVEEINAKNFSAEITMVEIVVRDIRGTIEDVAGAVSGVTVALKDTAYSATTDSDGVFVIEDVVAGDYELEVSKSGYISVEKTIGAESFSSSELSLGTIYLTREYLDLGTISADAMTYGIYMTRNSDGFLIRFISEGLTSGKLASERVECWFSVGETLSATRNQDTWLLCVYGSGTFYLANFPSNK